MTPARHTNEEIERAARDFEARLEQLDPETVHMECSDDLQAVADAADRLRSTEGELLEVVRTARRRGRSWNRIAVALGVSRQAARQRFADRVDEDPMTNDIVSFLRNSALAPQSVDAHSREIPRWVRRLRSMGITSVPQHPLLAKNQMEVDASNELNLFIKQSMPERDKSDEHKFRNFLRVRRWKP